jgi:peptide/nickel transport system permease protein
MATYLLRRLLLMIPTLFGILTLVFFVLALQPGGIGGALLSQMRSARGADAAKQVEYYEKRYHVKEPVYVQFGYYLNHLSPLGFEQNDDGSLGKFKFKSPDLGQSILRHRRVSDLIAESLPLTLLLNLVSIPLIYVVGILGGIRAARHRGGLFDTGFGSVQLAVWSMPTIWVGVLLIGFFANREYFHWFNTGNLIELDARDMPFLPHQTATGEWERGYLVDLLWHLVLPVFCLTYGGSAFITKLVRGSVLENLSADFARTARAKGLKDSVVLYRHVFRNSTLALITVAASLLPAMLAGSVIVETIFSIPGMGRIGVESARFGDKELILGVTLMGGLVTMISGIIRDVLYAIADPRVTYS